MSESLHEEMFQGTTFSNVLKDIYDNSSKKRKQIDILINELRPLIKDVSQAVMVVPLIKEYLEVGVKNDEQLVKMAGVYQKFLAAETRLKELQGENGSLLSEEEKKQLLAEIDKDIFDSATEITNAQTVIDDGFEALNRKIQDVSGSINNNG